MYNSNYKSRKLEEYQLDSLSNTLKRISLPFCFLIKVKYFVRNTVIYLVFP